MIRRRAPGARVYATRLVAEIKSPPSRCAKMAALPPRAARKATACRRLERSFMFPDCRHSVSDERRHLMPLTIREWLNTDE